MRFMLNIRVQLPGEWTAEQREEIARRETEAAIDLIRRGILRRIWRVVGARANFSIWETESLEQLHQVLQELPMYPFMTITVTPIIKHPVEEAYEARHGAMPELS